MPDQKINILVVDDEPDFRLILTDILSRAGYRTREAVNGKEGLKAIEAQKPDLIVMDWNMPEMTGPELCQNLRINPKFQTIPVIMLTVRRQDTDQAEGLHQGADLYLTKPVKPEEFLLRVKSLLRRAERD